MKTVSDEVFNELKEKAIEIWQTYDDTYGYASEKIDYLNSFGNVGDNFGTIIGMFDINNQLKLYELVGNATKYVIDDWVGDIGVQVENARQMGLF